MYHLKKVLRATKERLQQIPVSEILIRWGRWLDQKKRIVGLVLLGLMALKLTLGRLRLVTLQGDAMGMHYSIKYLDRWGRNYQEEIDALLVRLHQSLSNSSPDSELSRFNEHDCSAFYFTSPFFYPVLSKSKEVYRNTAGSFDPTILPLVNAWEETSVTDPDSLQINTLREYVSLDYIVAHEQRTKKLKEGVKLDFRGMLKGYAADQIASLLRTHGVEHMWIALGSELVVYGRPNKRKFWHTAIHPYIASLVDDNLQITIDLVDKAVAISSKQPQGTDNRQSCIIDPATGYPVQHILLAAVVVAQDCMTADAYATAMMVRGLAFAQELVEKQEGLAVFLIYEDDNGVPSFYTSPGLQIQQGEHSITLQLTQKPS